MTSDKKLSEFSGNKLHWLRFQQAFDLSTKLGEYSEEENIMRLFNSLKDEARDSTSTLFASGSTAREIMSTLERRFGDRRVIIEKMVDGLRQLNKVDSSKMDLVEFSSKLSDSVTSIKSLGSTDYLNSPELRKEILRKVPEFMLQDFARFAAAESDEISKLEKLASFMLKESKIASKAGIIDLHRDDSNINERKPKSSRVTNANQKAVFSLQAHEPQIVDEMDNGVSNVSKCTFCGRSNHAISLCRDFMRESRQERWKIVRRLKLYYNC